MVYRAEPEAMESLARRLAVCRAECSIAAAAAGGLLASHGQWAAHGSLASAHAAAEAWLDSWHRSLVERIALLDDAGAPLPAVPGNYQRDAGLLAVLVADIPDLAIWNQLPDAAAKGTNARKMTLDLLRERMHELRVGRIVRGAAGHVLVTEAEGEAPRLAAALGLGVDDLVTVGEAMRGGLGPGEVGLDAVLFPSSYLETLDPGIGELSGRLADAQGRLGALRADLDTDRDPWRDTFGEQTAAIEEVAGLEQRLGRLRAAAAAGVSEIIGHLLAMPFVGADDRKRAVGRVLAGAAVAAHEKGDDEGLAEVAEAVIGLQDGVVAAALLERLLTDLPRDLALDLQGRLHDEGPGFFESWLDATLGLSDLSHGPGVLAEALPHLTREIEVPLPDGVLGLSSREIVSVDEAGASRWVFAVDVERLPMADRVTPERVAAWAKRFDRVSKSVDVVVEGFEVVDAWHDEGIGSAVREAGESVVEVATGWTVSAAAGKAGFAIFCGTTGGVGCVVAVGVGALVLGWLGESAVNRGYTWLWDEAPVTIEHVLGTVRNADRFASSGRGWRPLLGRP